MRYEISLRVLYQYDWPVAAGRHRLLLSPAQLLGEQRVIASRLMIQPTPEEQRPLVDFFGNASVDIAFRSPHSEIAFEVRARVERNATVPAEFDFSLDQLPAALENTLSVDPDSPHHFLGPSPRIRLVPAITRFAQASTEGTQSLHELIQQLGERLQSEMRFDPQATQVDTSPEEAFAQRSGVCQDFSQVMITCLRGLGIPAGYVSGFLRTLPPPGQERLEGADAMHAWVRVWCGPEVGWSEYDPTNTVWVGSDHIVIARGRDYADVAPVRGVLRTAGSQSSSQAVDVIPLDLPPSLDTTAVAESPSS